VAPAAIIIIIIIIIIGGGGGGGGGGGSSTFRIAVNTNNLHSELVSCDCLCTRPIELNFIN